MNTVIKLKGHNQKKGKERPISALPPSQLLDAD